MNWGAAVDPRVSRGAGLREVLCGVWGGCGLDAGEVPRSWRGTPRLTQRRTAQSGRVLRVGDAAGYVEPITGEGMSWAIASGVACADAVVGGGVAGGAWARRSGVLFGGRRLRCAAVARAVRSAGLTGVCLAVGALAPGLGGSIARVSIGDRGLVA